MLLPLLSACFVYRPATPAQLRPGDVVAVQLTESGAASLTSQLGPRVAALDGRVVSGSDSALALAVTAVLRRSQDVETWPGDRVLVPVAAAEQWRVRRLDRQRSALTAAAITVGVVALRTALIQSGFGRAGSGRQSGGR